VQYIFNMSVYEVFMLLGQIQNRLNLYTEPGVLITRSWRHSLCYACITFRSVNTLL